MHHPSSSPHTQGRYQLPPGLSPRPGAQSQHPAHPQSPGGKTPGQRDLKVYSVIVIVIELS